MKESDEDEWPLPTRTLREMWKRRGKKQHVCRNETLHHRRSLININQVAGKYERFEISSYLMRRGGT